MPRHVPSQNWLEDVGVADFASATYYVLPFQAVDGRLNGCVRGAGFRKELLNFPNGCFPVRQSASRI